MQLTASRAMEVVNNGATNGLNRSLITRSTTDNSPWLLRPFHQHSFSARLRLKSVSDAGSVAAERGRLAVVADCRARLGCPSSVAHPAATAAAAGDDRLSIAARSGRKSCRIKTPDRYFRGEWWQIVARRRRWRVATAAQRQRRRHAPRPETLDLCYTPAALRPRVKWGEAKASGSVPFRSSADLRKQN